MVASVARWEEHQRMLIVLEQESQELCQTFEQMSEAEIVNGSVGENSILQKEAPGTFHEQMF